MKSWMKYASASLLLLLTLSVSATLCRADTMLDVPAYLLEAGCSPTAGAMLLGYYGLATDADIWHLAGLMNTDESLGGMTFLGWEAYGVQAFAAEKGYDFPAVTTFAFSFDLLKSEIDAGRPLLASAQPLGIYPPTEMHEVTVLGYQGDNYCFHDGWSTEVRCEPYHRPNGNAWGIEFLTLVQPSARSVPEPSSMAFLAVGFAGLMRRRLWSFFKR